MKYQKNCDPFPVRDSGPLEDLKMKEEQNLLEILHEQRIQARWAPRQWKRLMGRITSCWSNGLEKTPRNSEADFAETKSPNNRCWATRPPSVWFLSCIFFQSQFPSICQRSLFWRSFVLCSHSALSRSRSVPLFLPLFLPFSFCCFYLFVPSLFLFLSFRSLVPPSSFFFSSISILLLCSLSSNICWYQSSYFYCHFRFWESRYALSLLFTFPHISVSLLALLAHFLLLLCLFLLAWVLSMFLGGLPLLSC